MVTSSSLERTLGERLTIHFLPALFFLFFSVCVVFFFFFLGGLVGLFVCLFFVVGFFVCMKIRSFTVIPLSSQDQSTVAQRAEDDLGTRIAHW